MLEVVEGLNESFIRSTEKESELRGETEQQEEEEEEAVQRGTRLIFLAHPQKQEVGRGEPRGARSVSSGETGVGFGIDPRPPSVCPQADGVGLQISLMKPLASSAACGGEAWKRCKKCQLPDVFIVESATPWSWVSCPELEDQPR